MADLPTVPQALPSLSEVGRYVVGERVAVGGMAEVYRGWLRGSEGFRRPVVIKKMLPQLSSDPRFLRMFIEEARLASRLVHANIVGVLDFGRMDTEHFIVLEFIDGPNLNDLVIKARQAGVKRLPIPIVVYIISEVLKGLDHAHRLTDARGHSLGCVHRDVSPSNVLLSRDGQVKVSDFGVAKASDRANWTAPGQIKGKLHYLSPEQVRGEGVDPRADIFSVGVLLHELLTGRRLFGGDTPMEVMEATLSAPFPPPSTRASDVPAELDAVALTALQRDRTLRHPDAESFHQALVEATAPHFLPARARDLVALLDRLFGPPLPVSEDPLAALLESSPTGARLDPTTQMEGPTIEVPVAPALEMTAAAFALQPAPTVPLDRLVPQVALDATRKGLVHPPVARRDGGPRPSVVPVDIATGASPVSTAHESDAVDTAGPIVVGSGIPAIETSGPWSFGGPTVPDGHDSVRVPVVARDRAPPEPREGRLGLWLGLVMLAVAAAAVAFFLLGSTD